MMRHVYFSGFKNKYINNILDFVQNKYNFKATKIETIIPTQSEKMPYFNSCCELYLDDDDPNMRNIIETILNTAYSISGEVSALICTSGYYIRTISIERNDYKYGGQLEYYSHSFNNLMNIDTPSDSFVKWQIYEGDFKASDSI